MKKFKEFLKEKLKENATSSADVAGLALPLGANYNKKPKKKKKKNEHSKD